MHLTYGPMSGRIYTGIATTEIAAEYVPNLLNEVEVDLDRINQKSQDDVSKL